MIFNKDIKTDINNVLTYIDSFVKQFKKEGFNACEVVIDIKKLEEVLKQMALNFPHCDGLESASPFKKASNFVSWFMAIRPIEKHFLEKSDSILLSQYDINAIISLQIAIGALYGSTIKNEKVLKVISEYLYLSDHSYFDILEAIEDSCTNENSEKVEPLNQKMLSVLFEQIVYKTNPHCQYPYDNSTKDDIDIIDKKHKELNKKFKEKIISRCFKCNYSVIKDGNFCPICNEDSW